MTDQAAKQSKLHETIDPQFTDPLQTQKCAVSRLKIFEAEDPTEGEQTEMGFTDRQGDGYLKLKGATNLKIAKNDESDLESHKNRNVRGICAQRDFAADAFPRPQNKRNASQLNVANIDATSARFLIAVEEPESELVTEKDMATVQNTLTIAVDQTIETGHQGAASHNIGRDYSCDSSSADEK